MNGCDEMDGMSNTQKKKKIDELTTFLTTPYKIFDKEVYI